MVAAAPTPTTDEPILSLADALDTYDTECHAEPDRFVADTLDKAAWAARKLARAQAIIDEHAAQAALEIQRTKDWLEQANAAAMHDVGFFSGLLEEYHRAQLAQDPDRKTLQLPAGVTLKARSQQATWTFDEDAFIAWADEHHPELVKRTPTIERNAAKSVLTPFVVENGGPPVTPDGEVIPGVVVEHRDPKFSVVVAP